MKTLIYKLLLAIVLLIPIGLVLKKMINPSGKTIIDLDQKSEPVIVIKPESDLILIEDRHVEDL